MAVVDSVKLPDNSSHDIADNYSGYQKQTLTTPLTINGTQETTVEGALDGINAYVDDSVAALTDFYGSKNLLPFPYNETTKTFRGVTYTVNDDESVTCENTATNDSWFFFALGIHLEPGTYKLNGCPAGGSASGYLIDVRLERSGSVIDHVYDTGSGATFTVNETDLSQNVFLSVANGTDVSGLTFKPMVYDARIANPNHVPFAMTNKQLTQDKAERKDLTTIFATGTTNNTGAQIKKGKFFYLNGVYCKATLNIGTGDTFALNTNYKNATVEEELFDRQIIEDSATANTGTYGNVNLGINASAYVLVDAYTTTANYAVIPIISGGNWYAHVVLYTDYSTLANTDVTIYFRYIKL